MKSKIIECFDYRTLEVEDNLRKWKIPDSEIRTEMENLARDHSGEVEATDGAKEEDCVSCVCTEASAANWKNRRVLIYPGKNLTGAQEAEKACLGKGKGDVFSCKIRNVQVTLLVEKVIRRKKITVGPELFEILQLPGVSTEEEFARWYHGQHDAERRQKASYGIVSFWMQKMAERSKFSIDEEEKKTWCRTRGEKMYISMLAAGYDMKKEGSKDGTLLTEEEAIEEASRQQEQYFIPYLLYEYFSEKDGFTVSEEEYEKVLAEEAKRVGLSLEEAHRQSEISMYRYVKYQEHAFLLLAKEAETYLEV